ncbi:MAG: hypothetical protein IPP15_21125 [Saprospiraceae bacterium]|uniref:Uncharacterized protein n=1 Tax=Candidatus Opimibacter skivensis TaxID=2982028 RepID=A0A9D7SZH2_9BACT|nr:hypothetical protein [Candidatus Opimibacter skivensis]
MKLCSGHYGGEDEWARYLELDRKQYGRSSPPIRTQEQIFDQWNIFSGQNGTTLEKCRLVFDIISSLILQCMIIYTPTSCQSILHDLSIIPLLKTSLQNPKLSQRILFGTDFYVVRNHKSRTRNAG